MKTVTSALCAHAFESTVYEKLNELWFTYITPSALSACIFISKICSFLSFSLFNRLYVCTYMQLEKIAQYQKRKRSILLLNAFIAYFFYFKTIHRGPFYTHIFL
jgi:hypothetical protein